MDVLLIARRGILFEEMPAPGNMICFGDSYISMLHSREIICDQHPVGFTIYSFIDSLLVTFIRGHPREGKINQETLVWLCGNTSGTMSKYSFGYLSLDASEALIKYFRISITELWESINIFERVV